MQLWLYLFIISCAIVFYNYAGYALLVYGFNRLKKSGAKTGGTEAPLPSISFIVAAFNEEDCIEQKIKNSLEQDYPGSKIEFLFITDGSTDGTMEIIRRFPQIRLLHSPERRGKSAALNRAVAATQQEILIFSDANTLLNKEATRYIARHYRDPRVGGVAGEKKVITASAGGEQVGAGEGLYWKYESFLKKLDSEFYSVVGAAGELFSLRRELYDPVPENVILDDFVISLRTAQKGFRIVYEPDAYAMELPSFSLKDEQKRKIRIAAGGFQAIGMLSSLLLFWKQPRLSFLYISHRVLRWALSPFCLALALVSNLVLALTMHRAVFSALLLAQLCFYALAAIAGLFFRPGRQPAILKLPYYFVFMNLSVIRGFFRFLRKRQPATWEKAKRAQPGLMGK